MCALEYFSLQGAKEVTREDTRPETEFRQSSGQRQNSGTTDMPYVLYVYSAQCLSLEGRYLEIGVSWMQ